MCDKGPQGPRPFDPNTLPNEEYFEWLNKQPLSRKEYYRLFFARLKPKRRKINMKDFRKKK